MRHEIASVDEAEVITLKDGRTGLCTGTVGGPNGISHPDSPVTLDCAMREHSLEVRLDDGELVWVLHQSFREAAGKQPTI